MKKFLTLDIGTTAVKAGIFDEKLNCLSVEILEYQLLTPKNGWVELEPDTYWKSVVEGIKKVIDTSGSKPEDIVSITCTTQGETLIPVDASGKVLNNAIVWLDSRADKEAEEIASKVDALEFYKTTGIPEINGYCPVSKLLWIKNNLPKVYEDTYKFLLLEDYIVYLLSNRFVTNPAIMCTTGYFDITKDSIWSDMLDKCGLDEEKIPEVLPCASKVASLSEDAANTLGLNTSTIVTTGAMDQVAGAIGAGNIKEGMVSETTGTALVVAATVDDPKLDELSPVSVYSHGIAGKYLYIDVRQTAGIVLKWFRDEFCKDLPKENAFEIMSSLGDSSPPLSKGLRLYPHLTGVQSPVPNDKARGVFIGMGLDTDRGCFIRAIFEGIGYSLKESFEMMGINPSRLVSMGGGSKSPVWNKIKASICDSTVIIPDAGETASLGAAILGGVACGIFKDIESPVSTLSHKEEYKPESAWIDDYKKGYEEYRMMYQQFLPFFK